MTNGDDEEPNYIGWILAALGGALGAYFIYRGLKGDNYNCPRCGYGRVPNNSPRCPRCGVRLTWRN
ncbi:MAG: hypothetical protein ACFFG0_38715 [Candidatus Thorarchaeota archaeon]